MSGQPGACRATTQITALLKKMIDPAQIQKKAQYRYTNFLCSVVTGDSFFPLEFPIGARPKDYPTLQKAVNQLIKNSKQTIGYGYDLHLESRRTQKYGVQSLPQRVSIDNEADYIKLIKKETEVKQFKADIHQIRLIIPELESWLLAHPKKVVENGDRWPNLLKVCQYFRDHHYKNPNRYIRELSIAVDTKFIEQNKAILRSLLEAILPDEKLITIENERDYIFEKRFLLKYREPLIRLRFLYPSPLQLQDISLPLSDFNCLNLPPQRCIVTENLMTFLTLPQIENAIALFGSGYAVQNLKYAQWLADCELLYWGDLDGDGFKILSQMRSHFPRTVSIMMDRQTFDAFQEFAVSVSPAPPENLPHLTEEERSLYVDLVDQGLRLEQERINQTYVNQAFQRIAIDE
ncbi:MAG: Wadjet anti-phage system protein JetD domain-containing protein [Cyanobacteria bacterium P01_F01_bin.150]